MTMRTAAELAELYKLLAKSRAMTQEIERRIAEDENNMPAEAVVARRRRAMHLVA